MSGIVTGSLWKKFKINHRLVIDIVGFTLLLVISLFLLTRFSSDPYAFSVQNWAYRVVFLSMLFLVAMILTLISTLKLGKKTLPALLLLIYLGHIIGVLSVLFFSVDEIYSLDLGLGGGFTLGVFGIIFIIALRDLLGDLRDMKFWQKYWSELKNDKLSGKLSSFENIILFIWQPKFTKEENVNPVRDFAEGILMAFVLALVIRTFSLEAYKIPTGSMKPTLVGEQSDGNGHRVKDGDKILVNKLAYSLREPNRFEIIVFKYPLNSIKNFIKRCVGLPKEEMAIYQGDIWRRPAYFDKETGKWVADKDADFELVKKPWREQEALWSLFYSYEYEDSINNEGPGVKSDTFPLKLGNSVDADWTPTTIDYEPNHSSQARRNREYVDWEYDSSTAWKAVGEGKEVSFEADVIGRQPSAIGFAKFINDRYTLPRSNREYETYDYKDKREIEQNERSFPGFAPVADAKFRSVWTLGEKSAFKIQYHRAFESTLDINESEIWVELVVSTEKSDLVVKVLDSNSAMRTIECPENFEELLKKHKIKIKPGKEYIVDFAYVDGDVVISINHKMLIRWSIDIPLKLPRELTVNDTRNLIPDTTYFRFVALEGSVSFKHPEFWRDIYYRPEGICNPSVVIPEGNFFALGDNCKNSKDSRLWYEGVFRIKTEDGEYELRTEMDPGSDSKTSPKLDLLSMNRFDENDFASSKFKFEISELQRDFKVISIEDVYGVVHAIPTESIISFEIRNAPFVPYENLLGKAMIRFWPLMGMKFAR